jgi:DNA polymerase-3 subunit epsilon
VEALLPAAWRRQLAARRASGALAELLRQGPPPRVDWREQNYPALDIESPGLDPQRDQIVGIGWVRLERASVLVGSARQELVAGEDGVGQSATIHQITDSARQGGRPLGDVLDELLPQLESRILVLHHAPLDLGLLRTACRRLYGAALTWPHVDTLQAERERYARRGQHPGPGELRLGACRARYGLPDYPAHDALTDALATAELFLAQAVHQAGAARLPTQRLPGFRAA